MKEELKMSNIPNTHQQGSIEANYIVLVATSGIIMQLQ